MIQFLVKLLRPKPYLGCLSNREIDAVLKGRYKWY